MNDSTSLIDGRQGPAGPVKHLGDTVVLTVDDQIEQHAEQIDRLKQLTTQAILSIGKNLDAVHQLLAGNGREGKFKPWVEERCGFTYRSAYRYLGAWKTFGSKCDTVSHFEPRALYLLSRESTPEEAVEQSIELAKGGERITESRAKEIVAEHRDGTSTTPPIPMGKFRVIYADPPWKYNDERQQTTGAAVDHYRVMSIDELCDLQDPDGRHVKDLTCDRSILFLWATSPMAPEGFRLLDAWGFRYKAMYVWDKVRGYYGHYNDVRHELLLIGTKGAGCTQEGETLHDSVVQVERSSAHSQKPAEFYDIIESMYPGGPYIELFARNTRPGWNSWGNEVPAKPSCPNCNHAEFDREGTAE